MTPERIRWEGTDAVLGVDAVYKSVKVCFSPYDKTELMEPKIALNRLYPFATDLLVRTSYSVDGNDLMNAPEGFYIDLFQSTPNPENLSIHKNSMPFRINPVFSGSESEGLAWIVKIRANKYGLYNEILKNPVFTNYETLMKINKRIEVPNVRLTKFWGKKNQRLLRLKMGILLDMRYNPFESAGAYNEEGDYDGLRNKIRGVHIPFRMRVKDINGNVVKHYANVAYDEKNGIGYSVLDWRVKKYRLERGDADCNQYSRIRRELYNI